MQKVGNYFAESWDEMKNKVSWSSYSELQSSAILVLVASTIFRTDYRSDGLGVQDRITVVL
jgi:preprotein translocase subunit SecE